MVQVHGTMVPIKRLHLILFFLVALHARVIGAAPLPAQGANEGGSNDYPASQLDVGLEPLGHLEDPVQVDRFPAFLAVPVDHTESNRLRGRPRAKFQGDGGRKSPEDSELLMEILKEQEGGHEPDQEAMKNKVFPEGSSNSLPVGPAERRLMRGTSVLDAVTGRAMAVLPPPKPTVVYVVCPEDVRRRCMITTAAIMVSLLFAVLLWCYGMHRWRKRKQLQSAASGTPQSRDQHQQPPRPPSRGPLRPPSPSLTAQQQTQNQPGTRPPTPNPPPRPTSPRVLPQGKK